MKTLASLPFLAVAFVVGCSGSDSSDPFGPEPDYASIQQRFSSPSGTISERNMSSLFARYSDQKATSSAGDMGLGAGTGGSGSGVTGGGGATGGTRSQALHILGGGSGLTGSCAALAQGSTAGSCACPSGGSFRYDFGGLLAVQQQSGPIDASLKVRFDACRMNDLGLDGREFVRVHANRNGSAIDSKSLEMLLIADLTVSNGAETHEIDLAAMVRDGEFEIALSVDDGWVTVRGSGSTFIVRDRNGSWTCNVTNGAGTCRDSSGNTQTF